MGHAKYIGSLLLFSVFGISIVLFAVNFAIDNDTAINLGDIDGYEDNALLSKNNITVFRTEVINSSESFYQSEISEGETVRTGGQFKLGPATALSSGTSLIRPASQSILGSDGQFSYIPNTLITFLGFLLTLYIWKTWAGRTPD